MCWVPSYPTAEAALNSFLGWSELVTCNLQIVPGALLEQEQLLLWCDILASHLCLVTGKGSFCGRLICSIAVFYAVKAPSLKL
jgi:hypothetical protein